jgi:hypothetical protein
MKPLMPKSGRNALKKKKRKKEIHWSISLMNIDVKSSIKYLLTEYTTHSRDHTP